MKIRKFNLQLSLFALLGAMLVNGCTPPVPDEGQGYVTIETNPSVELVIGDGNIVVAVNGLNEDGKLLVSSEELIGLSIEEATQKVIELTEKLGFTVQGTVDEESQEIKISVSASTEDLAAHLKETVEEETAKMIESLDLDAKIAETKLVVREELEAMVAAQFPTLTEEEIKAMSDEELYSYLQKAVAEKALFASVKLEEYYQNLKEYEFKLSYKEELAKQLEESESILAATLHSAYSKIVTELHGAIVKLQETEVEFLTSPDSLYVQAVNALNEAKDEVIGIRVELGARETKGFVTDALITALDAAEATLNTCSDTLATVETSFKTAIGAAITAIETVLASLEVVEKNFPTDIDFEQALTDAETKINEGKDALFAQFEASFQEGDLAEIKAAIDTRKDKLEAIVSSTKEEVNQESAE